jgi:hypothetical protein
MPQPARLADSRSRVDEVRGVLLRDHEQRDAERLDEISGGEATRTEPQEHKADPPQLHELEP